INDDPSWQDPHHRPLGERKFAKREVRDQKYQAENGKILYEGQQACSKIIFRSSSHIHQVPKTLEVLCKIHNGKCGNHVGGRQWRSRSIQQDRAGLPKEETRRRRRIMGR
ncbi:unnamed protein product, partial [Prunus brigantina]